MLTKKELLAAAKSAKTWPQGMPKRWFREYDNNNTSDILAAFTNGEISLPDG